MDPRENALYSCPLAEALEPGSSCHHHQHRLVWDRLIAMVALRIRQEIDLETILQTTADEVQQLLQCDRVLLYHLNPPEVGDDAGRVVVEAINDPCWSLRDRIIQDKCFASCDLSKIQEDWYSATSDIEIAHITPCYRSFLQGLQVRSTLTVPILNGSQLWGLLIAHHCQAPRVWEEVEIEGLQHLAVQVGIGLHQATLIEELRASKASLEQQVVERTIQLEQANQTLQQLAEIVENAGDAMIGVSKEGCIISWNRAAETLLGYTASEILGQSISVLEPLSRPQEISLILTNTLQGNDLQNYPTRRLHKNGTEVDVEITISPIFDAQGNITKCCGILRGIGDRLAVENQVMEQAATLKIFYEASPLMMGVVEVANNDIFHLTQNPATLQFFGTREEEFSGHWASAIGVPAHYLQQWIEHYLLSQTTGQPVSFEYEHLINDQAPWLLVTVNFLGISENQRPRFYYVAQDISIQKNAERSLYRAEQVERELKLFEKLLEILEAGYWDWDIAHDRAYMSPIYKQMFGYQDDELPNDATTWQSLIFPEDLSGALERLNLHITSHGAIPYCDEVRYCHKDGSTVWVQCSAQVIEWDSVGKPLRIVGCHLNITSRKESEEILRQSEATNRALIAAIPDFLVRMRYDGLQLEVMNEGTVHCLYPNGDLQQEISGSMVTDIMPEPIAQERIQLSQLALATNSIQQQEYEFVENGITYYEEARIVPFQANHVLVMVRDISDRKRAELALESAKQQLELVIQASSEGVWDWDWITEEVYFSPQWKAMLGYADHELPNSLDMWQSVILEEDATAALQLVRDYNSGLIDRFEAMQRFRHKDGSIVHVLSRAIHLKDESGQVIRMVGSHLNLTETVTMQKALRDSQMQLRSVLNSSLDGIMAFRSIRNRQGKITNFEGFISNPAASQIIGRSIEHLTDQNLLFKLFSNQEQDLFAICVDVVESNSPYQGEFYYNPDGVDRWFETIAVKLGDGFAITFRDMTPIKQSKIELQQLNQQLEDRLIDLKQRHQDMLDLSEISDFLQACLSLDEACKTIASLLEPLFPNCSGGLFLSADSHNAIENAVTWGTELHSDLEFHSHACWGLRRGRLHWVGPHRPGLRCQHSHLNAAIGATLCIPMIAQGETLGLLHLSTQNSDCLPENKQQLAQTVSEQIALAIANLKLRETLQNQSTHDALTGLFNRCHLGEVLTREIARANRNQGKIGVVMLDLDRFRSINDNYGHDAGDFVLKQVAQALQDQLQNSGVICRYGGEEFAVIFPELSLEETRLKAELIRKTITRLGFNHNGQHLQSITASVGVAVFPQCGTTSNDILQAADAALHCAKLKGRDRVEIA
ncbi:MAG: PAS domain S-box protein [Oscillatoriales cyanobacterium]|nr:MAG: PAS domain S-box protein [Oscillatoriales cyanobacterium]